MQCGVLRQLVAHAAFCAATAYATLGRSLSAHVADTEQVENITDIAPAALGLKPEATDTYVLQRLGISRSHTLRIPVFPRMHTRSPLPRLP